MFAATLTRLAISLPEFFRVRTTKNCQRRGPMPTWLNDPQLSEQLLKDTGLVPEDLVGHTTYDDSKPFFLQQNYW